MKLRTQIEINEIKCQFFKLINEPNECLRTLTKIKIVDLLPKPGIKWDVSTDPAEIKNNRILQTILQVGKFRWNGTIPWGTIQFVQYETDTLNSSILTPSDLKESKSLKVQLVMENAIKHWNNKNNYTDFLKNREQYLPTQLGRPLLPWHQSQTVTVVKKKHKKSENYTPIKKLEEKFKEIQPNRRI